MNSNDKVDDPVKEAPFWISWRFTLSIIGFLGFVHVYAQRVGMSVAIVCMVNQTALRLEKLSDINDDILNGTNGDISAIDSITSVISTTAANYESHSEPSKCNAQLGTTDDVKNGPFVWSKEIQGHILGAFFYGYLVSQIPAGMLSERFGAKWVFAISFAVCTACTFLSPVAATLGYGYLIAVRVVAGLASGASYPSFHVLWSKWAPPMERSKLANICYAGSWMGNVIALPLSGYLCENGFGGGWPSVFYVIGISSAAWLVLWILFASDSPSTHWRIGAREKEYILSTLKGQVSDKHRKDKIPWCSVLKSMPVWAITVAGITTDWGLYTFLTNIPTYMYEVLRFDMKSNGFYSALPFVGMWAVMNISPIIADKIRSTGLLSTGITRKLFTSIGSFGAAAFLVGLAFVDCENPLTAVTLLSLGITISGSAYTGFFVNHMDIAPQFAGTLIGLGNGLAAATGFIAPYTVAVLTTDQTHSEWQRVFFLSAAIYVFGAIFYIIFASGEIQEWAKEKVSDEDVELQNKLTAADKDENDVMVNGHTITDKLEKL